MEWQAWGEQLREVLGLEHLPVAITYTDHPPEGLPQTRCRVCGALLRVAAGEMLDMTAGTSACPGGTMYLGLGQQPPERAQALREFLINGEKLFACNAAITRANTLTRAKPPLGAATHIVMAPLTRAPLPPDVTVFLCNAWQAARLINLAYYETGTPMECDPTGSLCRAAITYPLVTGLVNVTFGDVTARREERYSADVLFLTLPFVHLRSVALSLDRCSAGTAPSVIPPAIRHMLQEGGQGTAEF